MKGWGRLVPNSLQKTGRNWDEAVPAPVRNRYMNWPCEMQKQFSTPHARRNLGG